MNGLEQALHACRACKKQKRRCDKALPACSLCRRMSRKCDYSESLSPPPDLVRFLNNRIAELEALLAEQSQKAEQQPRELIQQQYATSPNTRNANMNPFDAFPASFFLDHDIFKETRLAIPRPSPPVPEEVYKTLGDVQGLSGIAERFFTNTHTWFPILCRRRFDIMLRDLKFELSADVALLFSAMHLITDDASICRNSVRTNWYWTVKNLALETEANSVMTPQLLQANVLIALYEIGHAIYPAAYLSVGKCATLGKAFGLDNRKDAPQMLRRHGAWSELEEIRRLWWAVLLLDRYVHLGMQGHALVVEDPTHNEMLPAEDTSFDLAKMAGSEPLYIESPTALQAGPFARACQAANLVGKVIALQNELLREVESRFITAMHMFRTLSAFVKVVQRDFKHSPEAFATPMALAYGGMMTLCDLFCCAEANKGTHTIEEIELQTLCINGMKATSDDIAHFASQLRPSINARPAAISPLIGHALYFGCITFAWRVYEGERTNTLQAYRLLRDTLTRLNGRWVVGGEYVSTIDKAREILYPSPLLQSPPDTLRLPSPMPEAANYVHGYEATFNLNSG